MQNEEIKRESLHSILYRFILLHKLRSIIN